eukprot:Opistho-2@83992
MSQPPSAAGVAKVPDVPRPPIGRGRGGPPVPGVTAPGPIAAPAAHVPSVTPAATQPSLATATVLSTAMELGLDDDMMDDMDDSDSSEPSKARRDAHKRANHNALERKRRDHIKDRFSTLKANVPTISADNPSRAMILNKATDYIRYMKKKNAMDVAEVAEIKRQNSHLSEQIKTLEPGSSPSELLDVGTDERQ